MQYGVGEIINSDGNKGSVGVARGARTRRRFTDDSARLLRAPAEWKLRRKRSIRDARSRKISIPSSGYECLVREWRT